jgi:tRNA threonylcarbamoyladenosine biosynthesis protein TsaB
MPMIVDAMKGAGCAFPDLDRIAVTKGPGSFTGVRVGLAAARGIGFAAGKPVLGIDRFEIYRAIHAKAKNLLVVIESKRAELFCKIYPFEGAVPDACLMTQPEIDAYLEEHPETEIAGDIATPDDDILGACAVLAATADVRDPGFLPRPLYLRAPDVTFPKEPSCHA